MKAPARKRFGQHFLEPAWVTKLVNAVAPASTDVFLEIGPGRGALTRPLAPKVARLIAVEIDRDLAAALEAEHLPHVEVITGDFLHVDLGSVLDTVAGPVRVIGNLPYNVSSPILFRLLALARAGNGDGPDFARARNGDRPHFQLADATLMLQKEVADRLVARPGTGEYGVLGIAVSLYADVDRLLVLPPGAFRPPPKVTSAVVRLRFRPPTVPLPNPRLFEGMVRSMFTLRRKTLVNALKPFADSLGRSAPEAVAAAGLDPARRPETLEVAELARLAGVFARQV